MKSSLLSLQSIIGINVRARHYTKDKDLDEYFLNPIIHRQINGDKIYVPLNLEKLWNN
jgi:hypothetical protein